MAFTNDGLKQQRVNFVESIEKLVIVDPDDTELFTILRESLEADFSPGDHTTITAHAVGSDLGVGSSVAGYKLLGAEDTVYYTHTYQDATTVVTELDEFTFVVTLNNTAE